MPVLEKISRDLGLGPLRNSGYRITGDGHFNWIADPNNKPVSDRYHGLDWLRSPDGEVKGLVARMGASTSFVKPVTEGKELVFKPVSANNDLGAGIIEWDPDINMAKVSQACTAYLVNDEGQRMSGDYHAFEQDAEANVWGLVLKNVVTREEERRDLLFVNANLKKPELKEGKGVELITGNKSMTVRSFGNGS